MKMNFQLAVLFGALALVSMAVTLTIGMLMKNIKKNAIKYHKAAAVTTLVLVVMHVIAVLM
jgi:hypothetical protein